MHNEDTDQEPTCSICGTSEYLDCGHLVANIDKTFRECLDGAMYDRDWEFRSLIEDTFESASQRERLLVFKPES
jgi:hypothetical protein